MKLIRRLKNLWELSAFKPNEKTGNITASIIKDVPTLKNQMAVIIPERSQLEESIIDEGGTIEPIPEN